GDMAQARRSYVRAPWRMGFRRKRKGGGRAKPLFQLGFLRKSRAGGCRLDLLHGGFRRTYPVAPQRTRNDEPRTEQKQRDNQDMASLILHHTSPCGERVLKVPPV